MKETALQLFSRPALPTALTGALNSWATSSTGSRALKRLDVIADKERGVAAFFRATGLAPDEVTPLEVANWLQAMEERGERSFSKYRVPAQHPLLLGSAGLKMG